MINSNKNFRSKKKSAIHFLIIMNLLLMMDFLHSSAFANDSFELHFESHDSALLFISCAPICEMREIDTPFEEIPLLKLFGYKTVEGININLQSLNVYGDSFQSFLLHTGGANQDVKFKRALGAFGDMALVLSIIQGAAIKSTKSDEMIPVLKYLSSFDTVKKLEIREQLGHKALAHFIQSYLGKDSKHQGFDEILTSENLEKIWPIIVEAIKNSLKETTELAPSSTSSDCEEDKHSRSFSPFEMISEQVSQISSKIPSFFSNLFRRTE